MAGCCLLTLAPAPRKCRAPTCCCRSDEQLTQLALAGAGYAFLEPGERRALRERMETAALLERADNSSSPFCLFSEGGACAR